MYFTKTVRSLAERPTRFAFFFMLKRNTHRMICQCYCLLVSIWSWCVGRCLVIWIVNWKIGCLLSLAIPFNTTLALPTECWCRACLPSLVWARWISFESILFISILFRARDKNVISINEWVRPSAQYPPVNNTKIDANTFGAGACFVCVPVPAIPFFRIELFLSLSFASRIYCRSTGDRISHVCVSF